MKESNGWSFGTVKAYSVDQGRGSLFDHTYNGGEYICFRYRDVNSGNVRTGEVVRYKLCKNAESPTAERVIREKDWTEE